MTFIRALFGVLCCVVYIVQHVINCVLLQFSVLVVWFSVEVRCAAVRLDEHFVLDS